MYSVFQQNAINVIQRIAATVKITILMHNRDYNYYTVFNIVSFAVYHPYVKVDCSREARFEVILFSSTLTHSQCDAGNITFCNFCCFRCASP